MRYSCYILLGLPLAQLSAQDTYPMNIVNDGVTLTTCSGIFTDDGGHGNNYASNITNRTITFCPQSNEQYLRFDFSSFYLEAGYDSLEVFYGNTATGLSDELLTGNLGALTRIGDIPGECVTFRFNSDFSTEFSGWAASISCITPCTEPVAQFTDNSVVDICSDETANFNVSFDASSSYSTDSFDIVEYIWHWGDGTVTNSPSSIMSHTFPNEPGWYMVRLEVVTNNTTSDLNGCRSTNSAVKYVRVLPPPSFEGSTTEIVMANCGTSVNLNGNVSSQTITSNPPKGKGSTAPLPDISSGAFGSIIDVTGFFDENAEVTASCLPRITVNLEHSSAGDLEIFLMAPSGEEVEIFDGYGDPGITDNFLGYCVNETDGSGRGCPAPYHFVNAGGLDWSNQNALTTDTEGCDTYNGACGNTHEYYVQDVDYTSANPLSNLVGANLNGVWSIRIVDHNAANDGYIDSWSIDFPSDCYRELQHLTSNITDVLWSHTGSGPSVPNSQSITNVPYATEGIDDCPDGESCLGNQITNTISVGPFSTTGTHVYTLNATDDFGCNYSYDVTIEVGEGEIEFGNIEENYCSGDTPSTLNNISDNGISGVWSPANIDTSVVGETTYTFTPVDSECAEPYELLISIDPTPNLTDINYED